MVTAPGYSSVHKLFGRVVLIVSFCRGQPVPGQPRPLLPSFAMGDPSQMGAGWAAG
eukprot:SAG11_NODE_25114_length_363_cov_1.340909_1_plen_55_part_10